MLMIDIGGHKNRYSRLIFVLIVAAVMMTGCFIPDAIVKSGQLADGLIDEALVQSYRQASEKTRIHYVARNANSTNLIVFIHGTPGDWRIFSPQLHSDTLARSASLVALDRPGWGGSEILSGNAGRSLAEQSALMGPTINELKQRYRSNNLVLVGHSLGGSLAPRIAIDHPELVDAVVVLAGDLTDQYPAARWYNKAANWPPINWLMSDTMAKANQEVLTLDKDLSGMKSHWAKLRAPMLVVQGSRDSLVDPRHADFAETVVTGSVVKVVRHSEGDHLVHLKHSEWVNQLIAQVVKRDKSRLFAL